MCTWMSHLKSIRALCAALGLCFITGGCASLAHRQSNVHYQRQMSHLTSEIRKKEQVIAELREKNHVLTAKLENRDVVRVSSPPVQVADRNAVSTWEIPDGAFPVPATHLLPPKALPRKEPANGVVAHHADDPKVNPAVEYLVSSAVKGGQLAARQSRTTTTETPSEKGEHILYSQVMESYRKRRIDEMERAVALFLKAYPDSVYADNALYLHALVDVERKDFPKASQYVERILKDYPNGNKVVSAMFIKAVVLRGRHQLRAAEKVLDLIALRFPGSPEAQRVPLEKRMLASLEKTGHQR